MRIFAALILFSACSPVEDVETEGSYTLLPSEEIAVLDLVNDRSLSFETLDDDVKLHKRSAQRIVELRDGEDEQAFSEDDHWFSSIDEVDAVPYIGKASIKKLVTYALENGYPRHQIESVFSPQPYDQSHVIKIAEWIDGAEESIDIAMYSFSDGTVIEALEDAISRGVVVRLIYEGGNKDRLSDNPESSRSAEFERLGANVRYVNKIMHHKYALIDGPHTDLDKAPTTRIITGSGNWSWGAASRYDENTLFMSGMDEVAVRLQNEFDLLWNHSRDFVQIDYDYTPSPLKPMLVDGPWADVALTSPNFNISEGSTTFRLNGGNAISDKLVAAIMSAEDRIIVGSGHLRSRPVSLALIERARQKPDLQIDVYLDAQEFVSLYSHELQVETQNDCLEEATTESQVRKCLDKNFRYGYLIDQEPNINVKYKWYSYRWHYSYAAQMHHKYLIIDNKQLWTGSYNLSDNAEHNTFENVVMLQGPLFTPVVEAYVRNFDEMWNTGGRYLYTDGDGNQVIVEAKLPSLLDTIATADEIPLVFDSMALTWDEVDNLKRTIRANCPAVDSDDFRRNPQNHKTCER